MPLCSRRAKPPVNVNGGSPADGSKPVTPPAKLAMVSDWGTDGRVPAATMLNVKWLPRVLRSRGRATARARTG